MFSKTGICLLLSLVLAATSCTPKIGEAPPQQQQQKLEGAECLSELQPVVEKFIAGVASDQEVAGGWDCAVFGIKKFKKYVYGRASDRFESDELAQFLQKNFLAPGSPPVTPTLRTEFMRLKQLFLGGSLDYVTRAELDKIMVLLGTLKDISLRLNPYMKLISQKWSIASSGNIQADIRHFEKASDEIQIAARLLANMIEENNQTYGLDHFTVFIKEFSLFLDQDWALAGQIEKLMPVVKKVKKAISGGDQDRIGPAEWKSFVLLGVRGYLQYLRYYYFIKSASETGSGIRLGYLARTLEDLMGAFQELISQKPTDPACGILRRSNGTRQAISCISKREITEILTTFSDIWAEFRVSEKLVEEALKIKKVIFGGAEATITSYDFERGKNKVANLKAVVEKFMPYYAVYSFEWDRENFDEAAAQAFFKKAQESLQASAEDIGALFEDAYNLDDVTSLLSEIDRLYPPPSGEEGLAPRVQRFLPLLKEVKDIVFSEKNTFVEKQQWSRVLKFAARFYGVHQYYSYFLSETLSGTSEFVESFKIFSDQVLQMAREVVLLKENQIITADEVSVLGQRLAEAGIFPPELDAKALEQVVDVALNRLIWPAELRLKGAKPNGLTPVSLQYLARELQIWYETEKYLFALTSTPVRPTLVQRQILKKLKDPALSPELKTGLQEIVKITAGPVAQTVNRDGHLMISNLGPVMYDHPSVSRLNLDRLIARLLTRGTVTDRGRLERYEGVTLAEAQAVFDQVKPVVVHLGLLDQSNNTFMESRFREANIFTAHGNGDSYMSFQETADIAGMIYSGILVNNLIRKDVEAFCLNPVKSMQEESVAEGCLRRVYLEKSAPYLTAVPEYLKFFKKLETRDSLKFLENILKAAGHIPNRQETVKLVDADLAPHVIQYIEMTISKFDANKNGKINLGEARRAFSSFEGILVELTKDQSLIKQKDLFALFTYILYYGRPPGGVKDYLFKWLPWKRSPERWTAVSADRKELASILGYIADQMAASADKKSIFSREDEDHIRRDPGYQDED